MQMPPLDVLLAKRQQALDRILSLHIKHFPGHPEPVFLISDAYPGVWLEHAYDAIAWAQLEPAMAPVARAQVNLFLQNQKEDGQFPCYVLDQSHPAVQSYGGHMGFGQIQECVSFAAICMEAAHLNGDRALLEDAYTRCARWDQWLVKNRMTLKTGLIEMFCEFDTGHDNSARFFDMEKACPGNDAKNCGPAESLPILAPDLNAVFYGDRMALSAMAHELGLENESAQWREKAQQVKQALMTHCYCPEDRFFYDVDRHGHFRKFRSITIANLFQEHLLDGDLAREIYDRYMKNPQEFWTPFPFPSMSISDPSAHTEIAGNCWGYYSQGLTSLRALRWMDHYGHGEDLEELMRRWVAAIASSNGLQFSQELHPITGEPTPSSQWYSSAMLFYLHAMRRLGLEPQK